MLTTIEGKRRLEESLFSAPRQVWLTFCREYNLFLNFGQHCIVVLKDRNGQGLQDIRTPAENEDAAQRIVEFIREKATDPDTVLHCSVAGGRKTMGVYMGYALQLFGREGDTLSHVLVYPSEMEFCRDFFYPPKQPTRFQTRDLNNSPMEVPSEAIRIDAAEIPFVRLRHILETSWLRLDFRSLVDRTQHRLNDRQISIALDLEGKQVAFAVGEGKPVVVRFGPKRGKGWNLSSLEGAYYSAFLLKTKGGAGARDTIALVRRLYKDFYLGGRRAGHVEGIRSDVKTKMNAKVEKALAEAGLAPASVYVLVPAGQETIPLDPGQIQVQKARKDGRKEARLRRRGM